MHIVADENIAQAHTYFSPYGELTLVPGRDITPELLNTADALLVRSVTKVNSALLAESSCRFVGTATSGIDHIDTDYLHQRNIGLGWARGCNAQAVVDYVFSCLAVLNQQFGTDWLRSSFGIVGCGEIGSRLATRLLKLGINPKISDPLLPASHPLSASFTELEQVLAASIVSLHTPLTHQGASPTYHLLNAQTLALLPETGLLINAARGEVIDNEALWALRQTSRPQHLVLDAWEGEPLIKPELLAEVLVGTPHIAGYSVEGKLKGTTMIHARFCDYFGCDPGLVTIPEDAAPELLEVLETGELVADLSALILQAYDVRRDHAAMQNALAGADEYARAEAGVKFDALRKHYPLRREFSHFLVSQKKLSPALLAAIRALGFTLSN